MCRGSSSGDEAEEDGGMISDGDTSAVWGEGGGGGVGKICRRVVLVDWEEEEDPGAW